MTEHTTQLHDYILGGTVYLVCDHGYNCCHMKRGKNADREMIRAAWNREIADIERYERQAKAHKQ
jgi:hypothetical protein